MSKQSLANSFRCALNGVGYTFRTQRNMRFHAAAIIAVIGMGWYCGISWVEWAVLALTIGMVLAAEIINTAVEKTVDLITLERMPGAGLAKDLAAGAVLITAAISVIVAALVFLPHLL